MISRYFIDRPIFATVLSIAISLTGAISLLYLPVAQYPRVTPPGVSISISYPGASAQEVADSVGAPIEQQVNGVEGMLFMSSQSGNDGSYSLTVTFDVGTDINAALVMVQNRVALAMPQLPSAVQNQGITIRKRTPDMLMIVSFISPDGRYDDKYLSNFATINVKDELLRVDGISDINVQGQRDYSMRIWLDPQRLAARNMTPIDVANAIRTQNVDAPAGRIGQPPAPTGQAFQFPLDTLGRLAGPEQFGGIIVKASGSPQILSADGRLIEPARTSKPKPRIVKLLPNDSASDPTAPPTVDDVVTAAPATGVAPSDSSADASTDPASDPANSGNPTTASVPTPSSSGASAALTSTGPTAGGTVGSGALGGGALASGGPSPSTGLVRLQDVARIELGAQNYNTICSFDGRPSVGLGLYQLPGTNALDVGDRVREKMQELKAGFPDGVDYQIAYDTTPYIRDSVRDVIHTLLEAIGLVAIVVLVFLQSWRAALIPLLAVPVAVLGTFAVMAAMGFSLNNISLFGLVLAIGIVVDDAIVVVENVERWMDRGLASRDATYKAMEEVTGPIIAVALVLCAVFVPCAFIRGITGQFFRQFAITIAVSTIISTINSLTFSPAMAAILLRPRHERPDLLGRALNVSFGWFFWLFNRASGFGTSAYAWITGRLMRLSLLVLLVYAGLLVLTGWTFEDAPKGFIPQQDQGRLIVNIQLPDAASLERTHEAALEVERIARDVPGVAHTVTNSGMSFLLQANSPNFASMFIVLKPFGERQQPDLTANAIMAKLRKRWAEKVPDAQVTVFSAAPVPGLGSAGGFKFMVEDRGGLGVRSLEQRMDDLVERFKKMPHLTDARTQFRSRIPQLRLDVDRAKAAALGVSLQDLNQTISLYLGSLYVNSYNDFGRHWQVTAQADGDFRTRPEQIHLFQVRSKSGQMVPLSTLVQVRDLAGPISVTRYNLYTAAPINGNVTPGVSDGDAISAINQEADATLPLSMRVEWTDLMFMQIRAGNTAIYVFLLSVVSVFLALAALYESWALPLAVILVVPLCLLCSVAGVLFTNRDVNIFVQIGLVVLVGLACKNAILIVEFAKHLHQQGMTCFDATKEASRLRLRPIVMTSFAFIFGVLPLMVASGAGAEMRRSLGVAVFSGMLGVTVFGIFLTPVFFYVVQGVSEIRMFQSPRLRWVLSHIAGAALGAVLGFLLARLGVGHMLWGPIVGACAGVLLIRGARGLHARRRARPGIIPFRGPAPVSTNGGPPS
ncbi:transporter : Cation/multidrug efflux pump OS=Singulisphaera acidiphila (strain ATCC BAA-1392 / DSM 18658 / VKM B-2454 / MOB10) GN=Sinac_7474 PE=4 SV=1: ACR_tran: ACR_tran [Gemmata massiliana]|uniref:SSD domain-containing protein n=1 Tax=Gemmata massiliana TaxID=1210884 RepID=A0A6P2CWH8_9BACT|nr:efflux RND transporter permease subunit [Gemmata massiliana]VTR92957.1 transporter : Cation/multidrug efflux pump OS=Singulisphaera acidiphila (strain ATCC BAA-1392 / DSM 18658 / VKM B-2454 / MOB10) GN=Sinac_7474 PE=4 SV=1: ACR_tran: ACR_tran [Gemmata massiliana]